jgi:geranylgeranyl diphosphate synthase type I
VAGDLLFAKVYEIITKFTDIKRVSPERILQIIEEISEATIVLCEGQTRDMMFENNVNVSKSEYIEMIIGKTAALFEISTRCGGILGGATKNEIELLGDFGRYLGIAFQIIDDILALTADETVLKKPVGNDIREGKLTLLVVYALEKTSKSQKEKILKTLGNRNADPEDIRETVEIIESLGAIDYAKKLAGKYIRKAKRALSHFPDSQNREDLMNLSDFISAREH